MSGAYYAGISSVLPQNISELWKFYETVSYERRNVSTKYLVLTLNFRRFFQLKSCSKFQLIFLESSIYKNFCGISMKSTNSKFYSILQILYEFYLFHMATLLFRGSPFVLVLRFSGVVHYRWGAVSWCISRHFRSGIWFALPAGGCLVFKYLYFQKICMIFNLWCC